MIRVSLRLMQFAMLNAIIPLDNVARGTIFLKGKSPSSFEISEKIMQTCLYWGRVG